jgi:NTP pyrophosphatase (non-canonical NTP hydrolase)
MVLNKKKISFFFINIKKNDININMNKKLMDFIQQLSNKDPKTLMQKTLKTTEECGELAKAVLPFLDSPQTNHKFSDTNKILEESCDVILCALSVAYNLGVSSEQIESMLWKKSEYWASLQDRESSVVFPIPFEIHVTVDKNSNIELFNKICVDNGIKPICLELVMSDGSLVVDEIMTSSKFYGTNSEVYSEICKIKNILTENQFSIVREKIETVFWHPSAPSLHSGNKKCIKMGTLNVILKYI